MSHRTKSKCLGLLKVGNCSVDRKASRATPFLLTLWCPNVFNILFMYLSCECRVVIHCHSCTNPRHFDFAGIGFNVVYQLTDCPILLSDHKDICMFDPHLRYVPGACDERPGGHVDLKQDANFAKIFPDFMAGFLSTCFPFKLKLLAICCIF